MMIINLEVPAAYATLKHGQGRHCLIIHFLQFSNNNLISNIVLHSIMINNSTLVGGREEEEE